MGLLLRGGEVVDPSAGLAGTLDVRVRDGLVADVAAALAPDGDTVLDVAGKLVLPGLIDLHAHCFIGGSDFGPRTDDVARSTGVTTWVDGGSTGAGTFEGMREWVLSRSRVRMFAFLNMPLAEVVRAVTASAAKAIGREGQLGTLKSGSVADIAVFQLETGSFDFEDAHGEHLTGRQRFAPVLTLRAGEIWWRRAG